MIDPRRLEAQRLAITCGPPAPRPKTPRPDLLVARLCSACGEKHLTGRNETGICRDCWNGMSRKQRREARAA